MRRHFQQYAFMWGLSLVVVVTAADRSGTVAGIGSWLKNHYGPDLVIILIFFFSGMILDTGQARSGISEKEATLSCLALVFLVSPIIAAGFALLPLDTGITIGIFLVAVMPPTLSSGVVMTGAAGGNTAHALILTILANTLSVITIPVALSFLLGLVGQNVQLVIDKPQMMTAIALRVIVPLFSGLAVQRLAPKFTGRLAAAFRSTNLLLILAVVWMAFSESCDAILNSGAVLLTIGMAVFAYHGLLLIVAALLIAGLGLGRGRRESVLFVGGQKTLPLSIILQVSLFPQYGLALAVCVTHHVVHMFMDGFLVGRLRLPEAGGERSGAGSSKGD